MNKRVLKIKNRQVYQRILGEWKKVYCDSQMCLKIANVILKNNEAVLCSEHYKINHEQTGGVII